MVVGTKNEGVVRADNGKRYCVPYDATVVRFRRVEEVYSVEGRSVKYCGVHIHVFVVWRAGFTVLENPSLLVCTPFFVALHSFNVAFHQFLLCTTTSSTNHRQLSPSVSTIQTAFTTTKFDELESRGYTFSGRRPAVHHPPRVSLCFSFRFYLSRHPKPTFVYTPESP